MTEKVKLFFKEEVADGLFAPKTAEIQLVVKRFGSEKIREEAGCSWRFLTSKSIFEYF